MTWRLGAWNDEAFFARFDEPLTDAESLPFWFSEQPLLNSADFSDFWSLLWQLQVAEYLRRIGSDVQWLRAGPDLSFQLGAEKWNVECYTYRISFGLFLFIEELLQLIDASVRVQYDLCMPFQPSQNLNRAGFIDAIFGTFLNRAYLAYAKDAATKRYPVVLYEHPRSSLRVYVEGSHSNHQRGPLGSPKKRLRIAG